MADDLRRRFGALLKAHRARRGLTQEGLAERAGISIDMIAKLEAGTSGARFGVIDKLAGALGIDPAELFTPNLPEGQLDRAELTDLTARLAGLRDEQLTWLRGIIDAALKSPR